MIPAHRRVTCTGQCSRVVRTKCQCTLELRLGAGDVTLPVRDPTSLDGLTRRWPRATLDRRLGSCGPCNAHCEREGGAERTKSHVLPHVEGQESHPEATDIIRRYRWQPRASVIPPELIWPWRVT